MSWVVRPNHHLVTFEGTIELNLSWPLILEVMIYNSFLYLKLIFDYILITKILWHVCMRTYYDHMHLFKVNVSVTDIRSYSIR